MSGPPSAPAITVGIPTYNRSTLLRAAVESVLAQTYDDFRILISDNASTDDTAEVVASYRDPRIEYVRGETNLGVVGNYNRLIELAQTELLMLLPDDDRLYPEYLASVVDVMQRYPSVGLVHTAFDEIDGDSHVQRHAVRPVKVKHGFALEPGADFLERSMTSFPTCFSTVTCRTEAIRSAGGMSEEENLFGDVRLVMRIALEWDAAYIDRPLVAFRLHDASQTRTLSAGDPSGDQRRDHLLAYGQAFFDRRMRFLAEAGLPETTTNRYRALASLRFLVDRAGLGAPRLEAWTSFVQIVRLYPRILLRPLAWRFVSAQSGGRALRRVMRGAALPKIELRWSHSDNA
jgi:glycosyltransferase involved in cell wall biosynthesis